MRRRAGGGDRGDGGRWRGRDRGVSEALGFVLVFALIISTVGTVYAVGMDGLEGARDLERVNNAERAFDVLADNFDDVARRGAPSRATEVKLADAQLGFGAPVVMNVSGARVSDPADNFTAEFRVSPVVYRAADTSVLYAGGAVVREQKAGSRMVRSPPFVLDDERVVLPLVQTRKADAGVGGETTVLVRSVHSTTGVVAARDEGTWNLTLNVSTPRAAVWREELSSRPDVTCGTPEADFVSCTVTTDRLYVTVTRIDVSFA